MSRQARRAATSELKKLPSIASRMPGTNIERVLCGWRFVLSKDYGGQRAPDGSDIWHFSASLYPMGRSSEDHDWHFLGIALGAVGVPDPEKNAITPIIETDPNAVHHWEWTSSGYDMASRVREAMKSPQAQEALRRVRGGGR